MNGVSEYSKYCSECPEKIIEDVEMAKNIRCAIETLTELEKWVIQNRFGFESKMTLRECQEETGFWAERIRQIQARAIRKLRHPSRSRRLVEGVWGTVYAE